MYDKVKMVVAHDILFLELQKLKEERVCREVVPISLDSKEVSLIVIG